MKQPFTNCAADFHVIIIISKGTQTAGTPIIDIVFTFIVAALTCSTQLSGFLLLPLLYQL